MTEGGKRVLLLSLPNYDRRYMFHKEMGSGVGFKSLREAKNHGRPRQIYPIAELQYAAAVLREAGHQPVIDDDQYRDSTSRKRYGKALKERSPEADAIFVRTSLPTLFLDLEQAAFLRELYPGTPLHIFGPLFAAPEMVDFVKTRKAYDGIVTSEIEAVVTDIVEGRDPDEIQGFHRLHEGDYRCGNPSRALTNMQGLPLPAYDLVDTAKLDRFIVQTSRGCPIGCNYCPYFISQATSSAPRPPSARWRRSSSWSSASGPSG